MSRKTTLLATVAMLTQISTADALNVDWTYSTFQPSGPFPAGTIVSGTISNLLDNVANQHPTGTDVVLNAPVGPITNWTYAGGGITTVNGVVTTANIVFTAVGGPPFYTLFLGFDEFVSFNTFLPQLTGNGLDLVGPEGSTVFTTAQSTGVPEPASLALLGAGLAGLGFARRRRD